MPSRPRIGIDLQSLAGQKTGFGFYLDSLLPELKNLNDRYEFVFIDTVKTNLNTLKRILWDQIWLPLAARKSHLDLLFTPAFSVPILYRGKKLATAHDIIGKLFGENFSLPAKFYWKHLLPNSFRHADHIITISNHTKNDLHEYLGIPLNKITVIPLGARSIFRPLDAHLVDPVLAQYHLKKNDFILTVGTMEPRKNLPRLIEAWASLSAPLPLVIVGKKAWGFHDVQLAIQKYDLEQKVLLVDYIPDQELAALYNACLLFVLPSLYEGFGLPVLEAMACGAPITASNNSSLPEVGEEAGLYFDPNNTQEMMHVISQVLNNSGLRNSMRAKSLVRARNYSWKKCAEYTLATFDHLLK